MFQLIIHNVWVFLQVAIGFNLVLPLLLYSAHYIISLFKEDPARSEELAEEKDYAIIVTAYGQTHTLPAVVQSLLQLNYVNYLVYVVADNCDASHLHFGSDKVILLQPGEVLGSNTRSHFHAIENFRRAHTHLTILDSDNLADPDYLHQLNVYFNQGYQAVQGTRAAKNLDTSYACLDAARDIYYHFYDGELLFGLGSSATLAGSGMAFTVSAYKQCLQHLDITGAGFDKVLQYELVKRNHRIAFAKDAIVYDEKTSRSEQLVKQRARWMNSWFRYFTLSFRMLAKGFATASVNRILFGTILMRPPLFIFLILSMGCLFANMFINPFVSVCWFIGLLMFVTGFFVAMSYSQADKRIYKSMLGIQHFMILQLKSLLKAKQANTYSVATQHFYAKQIEEV